jgi:starch phosphorylase
MNQTELNQLLTGTLDEDLDRHYALTLGRDEPGGSHHYLYEALALSVRDRLVARWRQTRHRLREEKPRRVAYLSMEFLIGRSLHNAVLNLDIESEAEAALQAHHSHLEEVIDEEMDAGLGNGGLGRLAACFLDSCASLDLPVTGYGIRYQYGMFHQRLRNGYQVEYPDSWLRNGNPWEFEMAEDTRRVRFGGHTEHTRDDSGRLQVRWLDTYDVLAVPYDMPVPGYRNGVVNTLRLWRARATAEFNLDEFNAGSYTDAVQARTRAEQITMVLYPNDQSEQGKELRLRQQYFLASASLQDVLTQWCAVHGDDLSTFAELHVFQLNDTHPTLAIAELMRLLLDEHGMDWNSAWETTHNSMAYTNHTLLPEALEVWPVSLFEQLLPRLLEIIYEINARFLSRVADRWPGDVERQRRMSIIEEGPEPRVRMAYLGIVGSFSVNGVAALHTRLLTDGLFRDFYEFSPQRFNNKTNGVTPRRWLAHCNPGLRTLLNDTLGPAWICQLDELSRLREHVREPEFRRRFAAIKHANKERLAQLVKARCGIDFTPDSLFDVQVKRIHEYKRQLLNVLHIIHLYDRILRGETEGLQPRCVLIAGKAAPGYAMAKLIIKLVNNVAAVVNRDPRLQDWLRVAFLPDYKVTAMEVICPAADLSQQISTAGKEASGTGNMKFMMNGAVTIGTLDGANIEILESVGADNFFLFGLDADAVAARRGTLDTEALIEGDADFSRVMALLESGHFNMLEPRLFDTVIASIRDPNDLWMTAADFRSYLDAQRAVDRAYADREGWLDRCIANTAASGRFSSDRTIRDYARDIWFRQGHW